VIRITQALTAATFGGAFLSIGGLYGRVGKPGLMWVYVGIACVWFINAIGTAMGWTFDRERRRRTP
jgi:hypothetical protein